MKKMIFATILALSGTAFAQTCEVDMIDSRTNYIITTIRGYDYGYDCRESMKLCSKEIRTRGLFGRANCVRRTVYNPTPTPTPYPDYPTPTPTPRPGSYEARREISSGESVIMNNKFFTVAGRSFNGFYTVKSTDGWNTILNSIRRETLSITKGCNSNICVGDSVISVNTSKYVTIGGLSYDDRFATISTDGWNTLLSNVERQNLAETKGCIYGRYAQICVGNTVINSNNEYSTVVGIQIDGRVVLKSTDGWNTLSTNIDPSYLTVTR